MLIFSFFPVSDLKDLVHATEGDSRYIAPELLQGRYTKAADIFSLGIAILELACNIDLPSNGLLWQKLRCGTIPEEVARFLSPELLTIITWMMNPIPEARPSVDILLQYPRIQEMLRQRLRWGFVRKIKRYMWRKLCNIKLFLSSLLLCLTSCLVLKHSKLKRLSVEFERVPLIRMTDEADLSEINRTTDELNITPTLNNSIPTHTPSIRIVNSTPLNHHQYNGMRIRHSRADSSMRNLSFDSVEGDLSFSSDVNCNHSHDHHRFSNGHINDSFVTKKKLFFKQSDDSD
jgi:membrane-associated tyrosine/threonine-specific cdc2-inhibitory kinase